jgi:four helix bundle protein
METRRSVSFEIEKLFDFERLQVYRIAREHLEMVIEAGQDLPSRAWKQRDHLDRAADSVMFNIAEGSGKRRETKDRKRFFDIAQASAKECAAVWDNLQMRKHLSLDTAQQARLLLNRVISMLYKLE